MASCGGNGLGLCLLLQGTVHSMTLGADTGVLGAWNRKISFCLGAYKTEHCEQDLLLFRIKFDTCVLDGVQIPLCVSGWRRMGTREKASEMHLSSQPSEYILNP